VELRPEEAAEKAAGRDPLVFANFGATKTKELVQLGYVPDLDAMQPADIVLVQPKETPPPPNLPVSHLRAVFGHKDVAFYIQEVQRNFQPADSASWVHVGLYVGRDLMVEAIPGGVTVSAFSRYAPTHRIKIRRVKDLDAAQAHNVCVEALRRLGDPYDSRAAIRLWLARSNGRPDLHKSAFICSELVRSAFLFGAERPIANTGDRTPTPADIAAPSVVIADVDEVGWRPLA
jgi:hypothetical protein